MTRILAIDASPTGSGRTRTVLDDVLVGAEAAGAKTAVVGLAGEDAVDRAVEMAGQFDAFVFGSPAYRASFATPMKAFLDACPRGFWGETEAPITARATAMVLTGSTFHHYLALNDLRNALAGFFGCHVLSPGLYVPSDGFTENKELREEYSALALAQGKQLVALAGAVAASPALGAVQPQA